MGLRRMARPAVEERSTVDLSAYAALWRDAHLGYSPVPVSVQSAVTNAACSAVIDTLATSVSQTPLDGIRQAGKQRVPVTPTPRLIADPSGLVGQDEWLYQLVDSMATDGNFFGQITTYSSTGMPTTIETIDPGTVGDRRIENGRPTVSINGERLALYPYGDIWHVPGKFMRAGNPFAQSPIDRARSTIGAAIAARDFGSKFFGDGAHPGGLITSETKLDAEQAAAIKKAWLNAVKGSREPAVLGAGLTYTPLMVNPNDSQFIDLMRFAIEEACRFWKVPPSMVYAATSGQNVTYANATQADLSYMKHSVEFYFRRIENRLSKVLPQPQKALFNRNAFLRSDPVTRSEVIDRRLKNKSMSINEYRALEDEEPFDDPEFDKPGIPVDMADPAVDPTPTDQQPTGGTQ